MLSWVSIEMDYHLHSAKEHLGVQPPLGPTQPTNLSGMENEYCPRSGGNAV